MLVEISRFVLISVLCSGLMFVWLSGVLVGVEVVEGMVR